MSSVRVRSIAILAILAALSFENCPRCCFAEEPFTRKVDVIYGRKFGTALTLDVFTPRGKPNGAAVIIMVSGGFVSNHDSIQPAFVLPFVNRGYTVFAVVHGSQPKFTVPEIVADVNRAVRFIRYHAKEYGIDPDRVGVTGASAGGHLSLMLGTAGTPGDPNARDPVDRESSRVQAVACFFPPTDFFNYGGPGKEFLHAKDHNPPFRAAFQYEKLDPESRMWVEVKDEEALRKIAREVSPLYHASADDPPTLLIHGDADPLVPLQQSEAMVQALKKAGVKAELVVKPKGGHGWPTIVLDFNRLADWFDEHLKPTSGEGKPPTERAVP